MNNAYNQWGMLGLQGPQGSMYSGHQQATMQSHMGIAQNQACHRSVIFSQTALGNCAAGYGAGLSAARLVAWESPMQSKAWRAKEIAAEVRARHPEMQVQRRTRKDINEDR